MEAYRRGGCRLRRGAPAALLVAVLAMGSTAALGASTASKAAAASTSGVGPGRERLPGHQGLVPPGATLVGPAPAATALPLVVTLKPRDPVALTTAVQMISDPGSPQYRRFLTPAQFAQQFGPTASTVRQVTSALRQEGLTVGAPSSTGLSLPISGTVAQVQSAFSTSISKYHLSSGKTGYDNASAPEVPTSVAPQIEGILGLDTLSPPQPSTGIPQPSPAAPHPESAAAPEALAPGQPSPVTGTCASSISSVQSMLGALDAPELAQAYSFNSLYSSSDYGAGSTVALVEPTGGAGYSANDINTFANCYGITLGGGQITPITVGASSATGPGTAEAELDIETVLSLAPQATIDVYEGGALSSLYDVFNQIVSDDTAKIVSDSWINGCEAYVPQTLQNSENTLFQAAAAEGQSIFVPTGDQGSEGCNINGKVSASTGVNPVAQAVDPSTGTLYIANESSNTVSVDSEGSAGNPTNSGTLGSVTTGSGPDAVALDAPAQKVFVANSGSTLTVIPTTCNQSTTSGCTSPTQVASGGNLNAPTALAVSGDGSTLYVGNGNGTVAVYNAGTNAWVTTVNLPSGSAPTALAVDTTNGYVYVADGTNNRIEYFNATTCNASTTSGCSLTRAVSVGNDPVALAVAKGPGDLYVANAGSGGGISVVSLSTHGVLTTIPTSQAHNGTGVVQSIGLSPDNNEVLAVLNGLRFPGDVLATINTTTNTITATVNLGTGADTMGQLVSDGTRNYVWVTDQTDQTGRGDVLQNLNLAVSDPASQPYVTAVGGTSLGHGTQNQALGPPPTEQAWNDALFFSDGAGGGGISQTFTMPAYQSPLGTVSGSSGTPCANAGGDCREVPDVSADADPSSGYVMYDNVDGLNWTALGGTSAAVPLWAAVVAVVASAKGNTAGYGALNPALYLLAKQSPGTFLNDVTAGNNDYNATGGGQFPAMAGYDMATGLGTPVASALATGLSAIPLSVAVSGSQTYGGSPTFTAVANFSGPGTTPFGVTLNTSGLNCTKVAPSTTIGPTLAPGTYSLVASSCSGLVPGGPDGADYSVVYTTAANDFTAAAPPPTAPAPPVTPATPPPPTYGYWLVGSDGGIFTFGSAQFHGSTGNLRLQRPVVGISPTANKAGYWLVASDGGVFAFGDAGYFGSIPGAGLNPAGSGLPHSLNAPIVGMVPSSDGGGYFMVASDGGVFAFGDARFEGSCPGIGGCSGAAVAVVPDASGNGYWLITQSGSVYAFGDAPFYGAPGGQGSPVTSAVRTADGHGYWILLANGAVYAYGDAVARGGPIGSVGGLNPASAIFSDATGGGYWVASAQGAVFPYGDAPNDGSMAGTHLNGSIIAATGF